MSCPANARHTRRPVVASNAYSVLFSEPTYARPLATTTPPGRRPVVADHATRSPPTLPAPSTASSGFAPVCAGPKPSCGHTSEVVSSSLVIAVSTAQAVTRTTQIEARMIECPRAIAASNARPRHIGLEPHGTNRHAAVCNNTARHIQTSSHLRVLQLLITADCASR